MASPANVTSKKADEVVPPEGTKEGTLHWIHGPGWFEERRWVGTGWKKDGQAYVVSPFAAYRCEWKYGGPVSSSPTVNEGVFNFNESFPGPHMVRVRLTKDQAWQTLQKLAKLLKSDHATYTLAYFGELVRDAEEDQGNPIEVEKHDSAT